MRKGANWAKRSSWGLWVTAGALLGLLHCGGETKGTPSAGRANAPKTNDPPVPADIYCFHAGTRIATDTGTRPIEQLEPGDSVLGFDERAERIVVERVMHKSARANAPLVRVGLLGGRELRATAEHPFYVPSIPGYVSLGRLRFDQPLLTLEAATSMVGLGLVDAALPTATSFASAPPETVYNLTVSGTHNYFAEGVLVHNKSPDECPFNPTRCPEDCFSNPELCPPEPEPASCLPPVSSEDWIACGAGVIHTNALWLDVAANPEPRAPSSAGGAAGASGVAPGGAGGEAGYSGPVSDPDSVAQVGVVPCSRGLVSNTLQVSVIAGQRLVGQLALEAGMDACSTSRNADSTAVLDLEMGEIQTLCMQLEPGQPVVRLRFENWGDARTQLGVLQMIEGC